MKILTCCHGGNVRSHAMAVTLKEMGHEAIAVGLWNITADTKDMMCAWANKIVIMEESMRESIPERFKYKVHLVEVGPDVYGVGINPELRKLTQEGAFYMLNFPG
jgi:hypothetical protein